MHTVDNVDIMVYEMTLPVIKKYIKGEISISKNNEINRKERNFILFLSLSNNK